MDVYCTRPGCPRPLNAFADLEDTDILKTVSQKFCTSCGMPLILGGRYLPIQLLGQGGFGAAFLARDRYTPTMRQCVVKQFQPAGDLNAQQLAIAQELFEREAMVLEELGREHPQIPDLYAYFPLSVPSKQPGKTDKFFYIAQEFIDGQTLEQELAQKKQFSEVEVLQVLQALLPVLQFIHDHHSIHRDIKPANLMRDRRGRLHLLDFGAVKQVAQGTPNPNSSTGIYSMGFAPPEQMSGNPVYPSTDLYALAVTGLMLLTGKDARDLFDPYNNCWDWQGQVQVSPQLTAVLERMLLPSPNQRFQSAEAVLEALKPQPAPVPVSPPPPPAPVSRPTSGAITPPRFSTVDLLGIAAFNGFEATLMFIAANRLITQFPGWRNLVIGVLGALLAGLLFAQYRRWIEKIDLGIIAGITLAVVIFVPPFRPNPFTLNSSFNIVMLAVFVSALLGLMMSVFLLVYRLLSRLFS